MSTERKKILLGISGGPDSMFLLYWAIKKYKKENLIVNTVNYNYRNDSHEDVAIVRKFCLENQILFLEKDFFYHTDERYQKENFEKLARCDRYDFFKENYDKYNCQKLLLAHHKDDFLETTIMQKDAKKKLFFYGIKEKTLLQNMLVYRPFIKKYFKNEILEYCQKFNLPYHLDYTNELPITTRNKIRLKLKEWSSKEKNSFIKQINKENKITQKIYKKALKELQEWKKTSYEQNYFKNLKYKIEILVILLHQKFQDLNLSSGKLENIKNFILSSNRTSKFLLKNNLYLIKNKGKLSF
ncbi:tRNA lysidine(34) synthetase TilS [Mycoplasmopsis columbina]|uniref:tRNA lysidine(34) synthetase TilS n=1 Tax=Mycoplasmopsis columbina TaxID=114881 RepID=UPI0004A703E9|nr:tRNA lysidine(34) synthetase TilS [Mycoplasmopsis columbina]VEU77195.1 tRNA(Ile)-lysidine synthase [Mycoplasmopsis columbina]